MVWLICLIAFAMVVASCGLAAREKEKDLPPVAGEPDEEEVVEWAADGVLGEIEYLGEMALARPDVPADVDASL